MTPDTQAVTRYCPVVMAPSRIEQLERLLARLRRAVFDPDEARAEHAAALIPVVTARLAPAWARQASERRVARDAAFRFRWE